MTATLEMPAPVKQFTPKPMSWTGEEYDYLVSIGFFANRRVELINGEILEMSPMNDPHAQGIQLANYALLPVFPGTAYTIRIQSPIHLGEKTRPEPDVAVIAGTPREVRQHPVSALLIVEISQSTLEFDRQEKGTLYAGAAIEDYWIVNLAARCVEVYRRPTPDAAVEGGFRYGEMRIYKETESISPVAAPTHDIAVKDLLP
jgi:Uma2 family endonuclease